MQNGKKLRISWIYFPTEKFGGPGPRQVDRGPGMGARQGLAGVRPTEGSGSPEHDQPGARARRSSATVAGEEDSYDVKARGCSPEHGRRRRGGE
jgi:hypothetical protein